MGAGRGTREMRPDGMEVEPVGPAQKTQEDPRRGEQTPQVSRLSMGWGTLSRYHLSWTMSIYGSSSVCDLGRTHVLVPPSMRVANGRL